MAQGRQAPPPLFFDPTQASCAVLKCRQKKLDLAAGLAQQGGCERHSAVSSAA